MSPCRGPRRGCRTKRGMPPIFPPVEGHGPPWERSALGAQKTRGLGAFLQALINACARSWNTARSAGVPSQLWRRGERHRLETPAVSTPACCRSGRCSVAEPWGMGMASACLSGTSAPLRAQRVVSRGLTRRARPSWAQTASARSCNDRSQPEVEAASSGPPARKAVAHLGIDALTTRQIEGGWAKHWGVNGPGRVATPTPLSVVPATASPGVITACASGTSRSGDPVNQPSVFAHRSDPPSVLKVVRRTSVPFLNPPPDA